MNAARPCPVCEEDFKGRDVPSCAYTLYGLEDHFRTRHPQWRLDAMEFWYLCEEEARERGEFPYPAASSQREDGGGR